VFVVGLLVARLVGGSGVNGVDLTSGPIRIARLEVLLSAPI
jgi:hypothetical protein